MATIQYKCDSCGQIRLGMKEQVFVPYHFTTITLVSGKEIMKLVNPYYICDNCKEYDRQKYMEV